MPCLAGLAVTHGLATAGTLDTHGRSIDLEYLTAGTEPAVIPFDPEDGARERGELEPASEPYIEHGTRGMPGYYQDFATEPAERCGATTVDHSREDGIAETFVCVRPVGHDGAHGLTFADGTIVEWEREPAEHWHVANGTPGYLFDSDASTFDNARDAIAYAMAEARDERDQRNDAAAWYPPSYATTADDPHGAVWVKRPLARADRWVLARGTRSSVRAAIEYGAFSIAIDRPYDSHTLPYQWKGWRCTEPADCGADDDANGGAL